MNPTFLFSVPAWLLAVLIVFLSVFVYRLGYYYRRKYKSGLQIADSPGAIEGSMLGLTGLLLAFTFNMSAGKFDERRKVIITEANAIGTAALRCDLYPDSVRTALRRDFQQYIETRISYYQAADDEEKIKAALKEGEVVAGRIWKRATEYAVGTQSLMPTNQMIPALNEMIDIVTTRDAGRRAKVPPVIFLILLLLLFISAFFLGYSRKEDQLNYLYVISWALMTALTLFVVVELDRPRRGYRSRSPFRWPGSRSPQ